MTDRERWEKGPKFKAGTADGPESLVDTLAAIGRHGRHVLDLYPDVYESGWGLAGRVLEGGSSSPGSTVEQAVTESAARARAQDASIKTTNEVREAEKRLGSALSALQQASGGRVAWEERAQREARRRRGKAG